MRRIFAVLVAVYALSLAHSVHAATRPWIEAGASYSTYDMHDVNTDIDDVNATVLATSGLSMEHIKSGWGMDGSLGVDFQPKLSLILGYTRLFGSSEAGDASGSLKYDVPANAFRATAQYAFQGTETSGLCAGASAGVVSSAGSVSLSITGAGIVSGSIDGSGPLLEGFIGGSSTLSPILGLTGTLGYRHARIGEVRINGETVYLANGHKEAVDYSGIFVRAALRIYLTN